MSSFTEPLEYTRLRKDLYRIDKEFTYNVGSLSNPIGSITVPQDFVTDLTSIPWPLSIIFPINGPYAQAAVLHDYMYSMLRGSKNANEVFARVVADAIFYESLEVLKINVILSRIFYMAVRVFGYFTI